jgi:hypothetical protein
MCDEVPLETDQRLGSATSLLDKHRLELGKQKEQLGSLLANGNEEIVERTQMLIGSAEISVRAVAHNYIKYRLLTVAPLRPGETTADREALLNRAKRAVMAQLNHLEKLVSASRRNIDGLRNQ